MTEEKTERVLPEIEVFITRHKGNTVKYERYNDGLRYKLDQPFTPQFKHAKFTLPSGKNKCERFSIETFDSTILDAIAKKYSNFRFFTRYNSR